MRVKTSKDPPSTGTWELVGIYGDYSYTEDDVDHEMIFLEKSVIDCARTGKTEDTEVTWNYDSVLGSGNYNLATIFGCYINSSASSPTHGLSALLSNGTTTYTIKDHSAVTQSLDSSSDGGYAQTRLIITDLSQVTISDGDDLAYEYERTA